MSKLKKVLKIIKFPQFMVDTLKENNTEYVVCYSNGKYETLYCKNDLLRILENDNENRVRYVFDYADKYIIDREITVIDETDNSSENKKI